MMNIYGRVIEQKLHFYEMREDESAEFDKLDMRQKAVAMCDHCIHPT